MIVTINKLVELSGYSRRSICNQLEIIRADAEWHQKIIKRPPGGIGIVVEEWQRWVESYED